MNDCELIIESFTAEHPENYNMKMPDSLVEAYAMYEDLLHTDYGSSNMDESTNEYYLKRLNQRITELTEAESKYTWPYIVAPYFTEEEISYYKEFYYTEHVAAISHHAPMQRTLHQRIIDLREELKNTNDPDEITRIKQDLESLGVNSIEDAMNEMEHSEHSNKYFEPISWDKKIRTLMTQLKGADNPDDIAFYKQKIIDLGWNPEIEYTAENKLLAKKRIESIYTEQCSKNPILDIQWLVENTDIDDVISESTNEELKPVHVLLIKGKSGFSTPISKAMNSDFSHAALCLDNDFNTLYSYNLLNNVNQFTGGFSIESVQNIDKNNRLAVFTFFTKKKDWENMKSRVKMLTDDIKNTSFSVINILTLPFKNININKPESMICSQFVDSTLKMAKVDLTGKDSSKVTPEDLYSNALVNEKIYKVFDGIAKDFDADKVKKYVSKMAKKAKPYAESAMAPSILEDYLYPVISEAKLPVEINDKGDILITNPKVNLDSEYSASHKLLMQYDKAKNVDAMKYELARLYYMNYILEKRIHSNKYSSEKNKNTKTRARVLNDFNKYMQILLKLEPGFNFSEYYEKSIFYPHTVEIKHDSILKLKDIISCIL